MHTGWRFRYSGAIIHDTGIDKRGNGNITIRTCLKEKGRWIDYIKMEILPSTPLSPAARTPYTWPVVRL